MGYGYGIWFLIKNRYIDELVERFNTKPHIPHLTIMCNMTLQEATKVYDYLKITDFKECMAVPITNLKLMEGNYSNEQEDIAYGIEFSIDNWYQWIETIKRIFKGDVPVSPHLSIIYRDKEYEDDLPKLKELEQVNYLMGYLALADIRSDNPSEWKIIR